MVRAHLLHILIFSLCIDLCFAARVDTLMSRSPFIPKGTKTEDKKPARKQPSKKPLSERFEIRGVVSYTDRQMISIWLKEENRSMWVVAGEEAFPGFPVFDKYDIESKSLWANADGQREQLTLAEAEVSNSSGIELNRTAPTFVSGPQPDSSSEKAEVSKPAIRPQPPSLSRRRVIPRTVERNTSNPSAPSAGAVPFNLPPPPSFVGGGRALPRVSQNPAVTDDSSGVNTRLTDTSSGEQAPQGEQSVQDRSSNEVERPAGAPPAAPASAPPQNIPQLPPGFDLEQYLKDRSGN